MRLLRLVLRGSTSRSRFFEQLSSNYGLLQERVPDLPRRAWRDLPHRHRRETSGFQRLGLAIARVPVLYALKDGAHSTQTELAKMAHIEQPTMAQLLGRMERDGLIGRTANPGCAGGSA